MLVHGRLWNGPSPSNLPMVLQYSKVGVPTSLLTNISPICVRIIR